MFRSIKSALTHKQDDLYAQSSVSVLVRKIVLEYVRENYPGAFWDVSTQYRTNEHVLVITTPSKTLAGELTMNTGEIRSYLTRQQIAVNRIVVR